MFQGMKKRSHIQAENEYEQLRNIAYETTMEEFSGVVARGVTYADALTADGWKQLSRNEGRSERSSWDWAKEYPFYQRRPKRFEITLWSGGELGAICYGQLSVHGSNLRMNLIESSPVRPRPLGMKALPILSFAAATFADIVGAKELWVIDPLASLEDTYKKEKFGPREKYHGKRIGQRRIL